MSGQQLTRSQAPVGAPNASHSSLDEGLLALEKKLIQEDQPELADQVRLLIEKKADSEKALKLEKELDMIRDYVEMYRYRVDPVRALRAE